MRTLRSVCKQLSLAAFCWLSLVGTAMASPDAHGAHHGVKWWGGATEGDSRIGVLFILLNFVVLMLVLNKLLFKNLKTKNRDKSDAIREALERATTAREEAESMMAEYKTRIAALDAEVEGIRQKAVNSAEAESKRILAEAEAQAAKIKAAAEATAERHAATRKHEIESEVIDRAMAAAEEAIRKGIGLADDRRLIDAYVSELGAVELSDKRGAQ